MPESVTSGDAACTGFAKRGEGTGQGRLRRLRRRVQRRGAWLWAADGSRHVVRAPGAPFRIVLEVSCELSPSKRVVIVDGVGAPGRQCLKASVGMPRKPVHSQAEGEQGGPLMLCLSAVGIHPGLPAAHAELGPQSPLQACLTAPSSNCLVWSLALSLPDEYARTRDEGVACCLADLLANDAPVHIDDLGRRRTTLPLKLAGLGLHRALETRRTAYWTFWADTLPSLG